MNVNPSRLHLTTEPAEAPAHRLDLQRFLELVAELKAITDAATHQDRRGEYLLVSWNDQAVPGKERSPFNDMQELKDAIDTLYHAAETMAGRAAMSLAQQQL
jgi:hypothetical protein